MYLKNEVDSNHNQPEHIFTFGWHINEPLKTHT